MTYQLRSSTITFDAALRDLDSTSDRVRAQAAHALGDVLEPGLRARAVPALVEVLRDGRPEVRLEAVMSLGELDSEAAVEPLAASMGDPMPAIRQAAAMSLGRLGFAAAFAPLARILAEGPPDLRFQAATSLVEIDPERAREPLLAALDDSDGEVAGAVALALGHIGEARAVAPLLDLLEVWSRPRTRFDIAYALADLGEPRAADVLAEFLDDANLAWDAIEAIERTGAPRGAARLAPLLERRFLAPTSKLRAAAAVLGLSDASSDALPGDLHDLQATAARAREVLLAGLRARKRDQRGLAVQLLGRVGGVWAVAPLRDLRARRAGRGLADEIDDSLQQLSKRAAERAS